MIIYEGAKVAWKSIKRAPMTSRLHDLVQWEPLADPEPGYTVVIGAMQRLWPVALANLRMIAAMTTPLMREVIMVFDCESDTIPSAVRDKVSELKQCGLPIRVIGYSQEQAKAARWINWGWVYSWMSWSIGISASRTRHVLLHDLDALPIDVDLFERLFHAAQESGAQFQGMRRYAGNGVVADMNLVTTFEMVLDAVWLRSNAKPFQGFNQIRLVNGRYVDFDTWLDVQRRAPIRRVEPISDSALVHPSQLICQFTDHCAGRGDRTSGSNNLPILAYFMKLGDRSFDLESLSHTIADAREQHAWLWGKPTNIGKITPEAWAWMEKQIRRLEQHLFSRTRPEIECFLQGFKMRAGTSRSVGVEPIELGGVPEL